jgi:hypothetical protein
MFVFLPDEKWRAIPSLLMNDLYGLGFTRVRVNPEPKVSG